MTLSVATLTGSAIDDVVGDLARLRIEIFRDWPYLYDGDTAYEEKYLGAFAAIENAAVIAAFSGEGSNRELVGAATCAPLAGEVDAFRQPFERAGMDVSKICYFSESVLKPAWRGQGIGHLFFDGREAHARSLGLQNAAFCAVVRPDDHPMRPADYRPLDPFWEKRGYRKVEGLTCTFPWKDIGDRAQTEKPMQFWMRAL